MPCKAEKLVFPYVEVISTTGSNHLTELQRLSMSNGIIRSLIRDTACDIS